MTKKEIRAQIRLRTKEKRELREKVKDAKTVEEVNKLSEQLDKLVDEIEELQEMLEDLIDSDPDENQGEGDQKEERGTLVNGDVAAHIRSINLGSFNLATGNGAASTPNSLESLALRSKETLFSRFARNNKVNRLDMGKYIKGAYSGDWSNATEERAAMSTSTLGVLIPQELSAQVIDKARNLSLFGAAEVPIVPMLSNNLTFARVKTDPVFAFKEELAEATESSLEMEPVTLQTHMAYGYAYVSIETMMSAQNLTDVMFTTFGRALANMIDTAMLYGQNGDAFAPEGILNDEDINVITAENRLYKDYVRGVGAVRRANGEPTILGLSAAAEEQMNLLIDANANTLIPPEVVKNLTKIVSNQLKDDNDGNGADALIFDPKSMVIGLQNQISCRMFTDSDYCIKNGAVGFQIYALIDCKAIQPKHIAYIKGLTVQEPPESNHG